MPVEGRRRASERRAVRHVLARSPYCRMRTKPRGSTCWTKRRRKLHRRDGHRAPPISVRIILPLKGHSLAVEGDQAVVADRDPMRIAPQIAQHRGRPAESRFGIHDPVGIEKGIDEGVPLRWIAQAPGGPGEVKVATHIGAKEYGDKSTWGWGPSHVSALADQVGNEPVLRRHREWMPISRMI
jgi:hypothetical protein